jgi:Flp pilus assembly protein TadD
MGKQQLGAAPSLEAAIQRVVSQPPSDRVALAQAISPQGAAPLAMAYSQGSFLNGLWTWWGSRYPEQSGFSTRQQWAEQEPQNAEVQRLWGLALVKNRRLPDALQVLAYAVTLDSNSAPAHLAFAQVLEQSRLTVKANSEYIAALKLQPDWTPALLGLGRTSLQAGLEFASSAFRRATQVEPNSVDAWIGLGTTLSEDSVNVAEALQAFEKAVQLAPARTDFYASYAAALLLSDRDVEAESLLRRRLLQKSGDAAARHLLSSVLLQYNPTPSRLAEAEVQAREALSLAPNMAAIKGQLGEVLLRAGKTAEAIKVMQDMVSRNPHDIKALRILARAYGRAGQTELAAQTTKREAELFDAMQEANALEVQRDALFHDPTFHRKLLQLYQQTGQIAKVAQQQQVLQELRHNPGRILNRYREHQSLMKKLLGNAVVEER